MALKFTLFGNTNVGSVRDHNEDNFTVCADLSENLWSFSKDESRSLSEKGALLVVADGMGGTNAGEVASDIAQQSVRQSFESLTSVPGSQKERENLLKKFILDAHNKIVRHQEDNLDTAGMGTTLVIAWVIDDMLYTAWSGDSRCYVLDPGNPLVPFTDDHSLVWELVKKGDMTPEEARTHPNSNIINQSLGDPKSAPRPDVKSRKLYKGNKVLVCSDGLNGMISDEEMQSLLDSGADVAQTCRDLVDAANAAGGHDNITCLILEVKEGDKAPAGEIPTSNTRPTNTSVLRKKVKYNYAVIGVLIAAVAILLFMLLGKNDDGSSKVNSHAALELEIYPGDDFKLDLATWSQNVSEITDVKWKSETFELAGTSIILKNPINVSDTLFVRYSVKGKKEVEERIFVFKTIDGAGSPETEGSTAPESQSESTGSGSSESTQPAERPNTPESRSAPETQAPTPKPDTTRVEGVQENPIIQPDSARPRPQRPRLNPIINKDTTTK